MSNTLTIEQIETWLERPDGSIHVVKEITKQGKAIPTTPTLTEKETR